VLLLAHAGHWAIWVLYAVPVLIVLGSIVISIARSRGDDGGGEEREAESGPGQTQA